MSSSKMASQYNTANVSPSTGGTSLPLPPTSPTTSSSYLFPPALDPSPASASTPGCTACLAIPCLPRQPYSTTPARTPPARPIPSGSRAAPYQLWSSPPDAPSAAGPSSPITTTRTSAAAPSPSTTPRPPIFSPSAIPALPTLPLLQPGPVPTFPLLYLKLGGSALTARSAREFHLSVPRSVLPSTYRSRRPTHTCLAPPSPPSPP